jgi:hypothetical protein
MLEEDLKTLKLKRELLEDKLNKVQEGITKAVIIARSGFPEFNRIEFHLTNPPKKITYDTKRTDLYKTRFMLRQDDDGNYKIVGE